VIGVAAPGSATPVEGKASCGFHVGCGGRKRSSPATTALNFRDVSNCFGAWTDFGAKTIAELGQSGTGPKERNFGSAAKGCNIDAASVG
jgi:hypothetical protein